MDRAYSVLTVKAVDDADRVIEGIASTPAPDRVGDIVESQGAEFKLPLPLLWQHQHDKPVGHVEFAKPTKDGIPFRARLANIADAGPLKDLVDTAWQAVKAQLVRGVSIGFRAKEYDFMDDGGIRFSKWEWLELSLVTIPANAEATIDRIKSIDASLRAASGRETEAAPKGKPAASGVKTTSNRRKTMARKSYAERIAAFEETLSAKRAEMEEMIEEAGDRTFDSEEQDVYDALDHEVKELRDHIKRLKTLQADAVEKAKPVEDVRDTAKAADIRQGIPARAKAPKLDAGIAFARYAKVKALARLDGDSVREKARELYGEDSPIYGMFAKAAVAAGTTADGTWAGPLVGEEGSAFADFVEYLRPQTILGRFGAGGVPSLRKVPFRTALLGQTSGGAGYWVGEGKAKPLTKFDFSRRTLEPLKVANIAVVTEELLRDSSPSAEALVRDQLAAALRARLDTDFISPSKAAVSGVSPASITNGVTPIASSGNDADGVRADIQAVFGSFIAANNAPTSGVWVMPATTALALSLMQNPLGQSEFPGITMNGGTLFGLPVVVSQYVPSGTVVLVNASDIYLADEGGISVDMSREASLEMADNPEHDSGTPAAAELVSMFQTNSVAFRAERTLNWAARRDEAVAVLSGVAWGTPADPDNGDG